MSRAIPLHGSENDDDMRARARLVPTRPSRAGAEGARSPDPRPAGREGAKPEGAEGRRQRPRPPWERGFLTALPGAAPRSAHTAERVAATAPAGPRTPALLSSAESAETFTGLSDG